MSDPEPDRTLPIPLPETAVTQPLAPLDSAAELVRVLDQYLADLKTDAVPDRAKLLADHPDLAPQLEQCLAGIEFIHQAARPASSPTQLGDFRIVRELGRGGMGVVYEAEQISLRRRVALKVLRFGAVADKEAIERFRREGETIAHLHHTNIVPIFAIGSEQGVSYYAMQFIEGGSLADRVTASPPTPASTTAPAAAFDEIARWCLEAAEALVHAHQRGVVHRDIKPSNLLLDTDGRVWLTDFGLARRADEVTLTMSGMLMGTPRYMSPEQATAVKQPIDHRTDIYSLGATLYELATGQPVFASDTAHGVISQILTAEPVPPRSVRRAIPRDLETIILKCLAKEPGQRYATAQALADDLRAFREGRAIKARRARLPERTVRWVQQRKKSVSVAAAAVAATLLIVAGLYASLSSLAASRLAHVSVNTNGPPLKVEVLDEDERTAVATFTAPTQQAQTIPAGRYHLRLSADGHLSETSIFEAGKGNHYDLAVALASRNLWEIHVQDSEIDELARIDGHDDVFLAAANQVRRIDGATGQPVWQTSLAAKDQPLVKKVLATNEMYATVFAPRRALDWPVPCLVRPLVDLDGDGTPDLIWASRATTSLIAVSGKSGKVLWCHRSQTTLPPKLSENDIQSHFSGSGNDMVVGQPIMADVGGRKIVVAMCFVKDELYFTKSNPRFVRPPPQLWLDAVDARTGETLWRRSLPFKNETPAETGFTATVSVLHDRKIGSIAYGNRLFGFNLLTGEPAWPDRRLDENQPVAVRFADLLGDGQLSLLFVRGNMTTTPSRDVPGLSLVALSPLSDKSLWEKPLADVTVAWRQFLGAEPPPFDWPLVVDLDGKGKPDVVVPFVDYAAGTCGLEVVEGATGQTRWRRTLSTAIRNWRAPQPDRIVVGPDLDGDGFRELFAASRDEQTHRIYVDALSGQDGHSLWTYMRSELSTGPFGNNLPPLRWWQAGADGWPQLIVSGAMDQYMSPWNKPWSAVLNTSSGRLAHILNDFGSPEIADFNGDGLPDLFARRPDFLNAPQPYAAGQIHAIRGATPEAWGVLSNDSFFAAPDLNGDGFDDLIHQKGFALQAISGHDGSLLWQNDRDGLLPNAGNGSTHLPLADLDGDGVPDLVSFDSATVRLNATSGRSGKLLWSTELKATAGEELGNLAVHLDFHEMEAGLPPDVLLLFAVKTRVDGKELQRLQLLRISGRDGQIRWQQPLSEPSDLNFGGCQIPLAVADLDGDGVNDIVFWLPLAKAEDRGLSPSDPGESPSKQNEDAANNSSPPSLAPRYELRAVSGRDGRLLWRRPGFLMSNDDPPFTRLIPTPIIADFDGGQPTVLFTDVVIGPGGATDEKSYAEVVALDGRNGRAKWTWRGDSSEQMDIWNDAWANGSPQVVRTAAGKAIVVSIYDRKLTTVVDPKTKFVTASGKSGSQIVVLNPQGRVLRRTDIHAPSRNGNRAKVWVHDLHGDSRDELVWADGESVFATRPGDENSLWQWAAAANSGAEIIQILPIGKTYPATIAIRTGLSLIGLAGPTGKPRWRFDTTASSSLLAADDPMGLPRVFTSGPGAERICGIALPTDESGKYQSLTPQFTKYEEPARNPRLLRPLPWSGQEQGGWQEQSDSGLYGNPFLRIGILTIIFGTIMIGLLIGKRPGKLRRAVWLIALWLVISLLAATVWLSKDGRNMAIGQDYVWSGWYRVFVFGFNVEILLLLGALVLRWLFHLVRWTARRLTKRPAIIQN